MRRLSNVRVRNVATIGGNLAHGDPHMDLPPVLIALGAEVAIAGPAGERTVAVEDLFAGYFETVLAKNELIAELRIPPQGKSRAAYMKVTTGSAEDWPALGVAVALMTEGPAVKSARIVVSAATEKAMRLKGAEDVLTGATIDDACLARAGDAGGKEAECISTCAARPPTNANCFASMWSRRAPSPLTSKPLTNKLATATERGR
jgi:carbon-monoxide dehydrogenase medium subunit